MQLAVSFAVLFIGIFIGIVFLKFGFALAFANKIESDKSAARARSIWDSILGRARTHDDWMPDARVKGGLIYNKREKRIEMTGRLSDSTLSRVFRRP
ncbi:MAG TPA: hypothetical protein VJ750_05245 [Rhizomicrobium sp.]|nr:hypothetical protein [Rhizomicrobium sp.]